MPAGSAEQRTGRLAELDALIYLGFGDVPGWMLPLLCRRRLYTLRRRAHPRRLARRAGYEPPEVRRAIYLAETGRVEVADRVTASQDVSTRRKAPARAGRRGGLATRFPRRAPRRDNQTGARWPETPRAAIQGRLGVLTYFAVLFLAGLLLWVLVRIANRPPRDDRFREEMRRRYRGDD